MKIFLNFFGKKQSVYFPTVNNISKFYEDKKSSAGVGGSHAHDEQFEPQSFETNCAGF